MLAPSSLSVHGHGVFGCRLLPSAEWGGEVSSTLPGTGLPSCDPRPICVPRIVSKVFRLAIGRYSRAVQSHFVPSWYKEKWKKVERENSGVKRFMNYVVPLE